MYSELFKSFVLYEKLQDKTLPSPIDFINNNIEISDTNNDYIKYMRDEFYFDKESLNTIYRERRDIIKVFAFGKTTGLFALIRDKKVTNHFEVGGYHVVFVKDNDVNYIMPKDTWYFYD